MRTLDVEPVMSTPQQFAAIMASDTQRWKALAERLGLKPE
jgi:tripartite-type tricarboxylate transporter receptor subunit TctC